MPVKKMESTVSVLEAAKQRIKNVFANGCKVYLSFSSGKDSLCMASITYDLIRKGAINPKQLTVTFIDEEGLYPSMVDAAERWRRNFESVGVPFLWFCLPFKQVSVIDHLSSSESWITWEPGKEDLWIRKPPKGAIMSSPYLQYPGQMNYQTFCAKAFADGVQMIGLRTVESLTRLQAVSRSDMKSLSGKFYPIYDLEGCRYLALYQGAQLGVSGNLSPALRGWGSKESAPIVCFLWRLWYAGPPLDSRDRSSIMGAH